MAAKGRWHCTSGEAARKTSGAERFDLLCRMDLDLVSNLSIKPTVSHGDHMHKQVNEMADLDYITVEALNSHLPKWRESKQLPSKRFPVRILHLYVEYVAHNCT